MTIRLAEQADQTAWDAYVLSRREGLAYQLFAWKEAVEAAHGFDCPYFLAEEAGRIQGVLPLAHIAWPLRPGALVSLPYCDAAGPLADDPGTAEALMHAALDYARTSRIPEIELRLPSPAGNPEQRSPGVALSGFAAAGRSEVRYQANQKPGTRHQKPETRHSELKKVRMLLSLPESSGVLLDSFKSKVRSQVKKPNRDGLTASLGGLELLPDFYPIMCEKMRDLGSPVHSWSWFKAILGSFGSQARCGLVRMPDGTPAAAGIILLHEQTVSMPWISYRKRFKRLNPNMLLHWTFLEYAADSGYELFDLGRSTFGESNYRFKKQWGAGAKPLHWVRIAARTGEVLPPEPSLGRARALAEACFRLLPVPAATFLGSRLRKYIPL